PLVRAVTLPPVARAVREVHYKVYGELTDGVAGYSGCLSWLICGQLATAEAAAQHDQPRQEQQDRQRWRRCTYMAPAAPTTLVHGHHLRNREIVGCAAVLRGEARQVGRAGDG